MAFTLLKLICLYIHKNVITILTEVKFVLLCNYSNYLENYMKINYVLIFTAVVAILDCKTFSMNHENEQNEIIDNNTMRANQEEITINNVNQTDRQLIKNNQQMDSNINNQEKLVIDSFEQVGQQLIMSSNIQPSDIQQLDFNNNQIMKYNFGATMVNLAHTVKNCNQQKLELKELRDIVEHQQSKIKHISSKIKEQKYEIKNQYDEIKYQAKKINKFAKNDKYNRERSREKSIEKYEHHINHNTKHYSSNNNSHYKRHYSKNYYFKNYKYSKKSHDYK